MHIEESGFALKNDGKLELFFIGTGSAFAAKGNQTNFILVKGDAHIMVDFGATAPKAFLETTGLPLTDIEVVLPTHSHADHIGGIECLALMNRYVGQRIMKKSKIKMVIGREYQRVIWDYSLKGGLEWNEGDCDDCAQKLSFRDFFDIIRPDWKMFQPREAFTAMVGGIKLEIFRTKHIPEQSKTWEDSFLSYGLFIDDRLFISGDTRFDRDLIGMYADKSEVMFHDVQFFPGAVHAPLADLKTLPSDVKKKMYLDHYSDDFEKQDISDFAGWAMPGIRYIFDRGSHGGRLC